MRLFPLRYFLYIYKSKPQFVFYVYFLFPVFIDLHLTLITLTIISSYQKIKYNCLVSQLYRLPPFGRGYRTEMLLFGAMQYWAYNWTIFFLKVVIIIIICFLGNFPNITRSCISRLRKKSHLFPKFGKKCHSWISQCVDRIIFLVQGNDPHIYKLGKKRVTFKIAKWPFPGNSQIFA